MGTIPLYTTGFFCWQKAEQGSANKAALTAQHIRTILRDLRLQEEAALEDRLRVNISTRLAECTPAERTKR
jgi:hypothetical protein